MSVVEWTVAYGIHHWRIPVEVIEVAIEVYPEWDLNQETST